METQKRELDLSTLQLSSGGHEEQSRQFCVNEAVAYIAGEPWSDHPACVSPVITAYTIVLNDASGAFGEEARRRLVAYIPRMIGTRASIVEEVQRARLAAKSAKYGAEYAKYGAEYAEYAEYAAVSAAVSAAKSAEYAAESAEWAAEYAAKSAEWAAKSADEWAAILDNCFACLDAMIAVGSSDK